MHARQIVGTSVTLALAGAFNVVFCYSRIILIAQLIISNIKNENLYLLLIFCFTNLKNVTCSLKTSTVNQVREIIIADVNGIQRTLYENDNGMLQFNKASVALLMPQLGQGNPIIFLNKHTGNVKLLLDL